MHSFKIMTTIYIMNEFKQIKHYYFYSFSVYKLLKDNKKDVLRDRTLITR